MPPAAATAIPLLLYSPKLLLLGTRGPRGRGRARRHDTTTTTTSRPPGPPTHTLPQHGTATSPLHHYRDSGLWDGAWTACSRIIHCVNHALPFRLRKLLPGLTDCLIARRIARHCPALPCPLFLSSPSPSSVRHPGGSCRSLQDTQRGPCQPCLPSPPSSPKKPPTGRPTGCDWGGAASAQLKTDNKQQRPPLLLPSCPPVACHSHQVRRGRGEIGGPGNLANGIRSPPARWEAGTTLIHPPLAGLRSLWVILPAIPPRAV